MDRLSIVGMGAGDERLLTERARGVIASARRVLCTGRRQCPPNAVACTLAQLDTELKRHTDGPTAVLVGGDCGFFSVSKSLTEKFGASYEIELINGISSIQYFAARLAVAYDDALICSTHGRDGRIVPKVAYNGKVFLLTGGEYKAQRVCELLSDSGLGGVRVRVGERLSYADERITDGTAQALKAAVFDELSVMYIENGAYVRPQEPLCDADFIRGDVPMTKEEVRWLALQKLGLMPDDIAYDIGAGTGAVAVEMARRVYNGYVYAVEAESAACELIGRNRAKHGAYNIELVHARAPEGLAELPAPDKVFIGGSAGGAAGILRLLAERNPAVRVVANAVTLQGLSGIIEGYERAGLTATDIVCVNIAKAKRVGGYDMMLANNPVYVITGQRDKGRY